MGAYRSLILLFQARELFLEGVEFEQDGKLFDAILKYKKAVHLVPDIEKRAFDFTSQMKQEKKDVGPNQQQQQTTGTSVELGIQLT